MALVAATAYLARKYEVQRGRKENLASARTVLDRLRDAVEPEPGYLVGDRFTFADIAMACALQFILPVHDHYMAIGPETRRLWTWTALREHARPCLEWRDRMYRLHRHEGRSPRGNQQQPRNANIPS
jgi:glutathione S-transferase